MRAIAAIALSLPLALSVGVPAVTATATPASVAVQGGCTIPTTEEVESLFDRWNDTLQSGDPAKVVDDNYAEDSILLPTLSGEARYTREAKIRYFVDFLAKDPVGSIDERWISTSCNAAVDAGHYTFAFSDGTKAKARYTYTYVLEDGEWMISSHHSSLRPTDHSAR